MATNIQNRQQQQRTIIPPELGALRPAGAYTFDELYRFAQMCQASGLFEDVTDAAQAMIKIVKGQELGLPPTTAMTAFDIIKKRLFIKPWVIAAKINACGYGGFRIVTQTAEQCTIVFLRKYPGHGWAECPPVSYTIAEAKAHGLIDRSPHWKGSPAHMLYQRAMGRGGALYFPELLAGLEMPPDDDPIPPERHRQNIVDLFGEGHSGYASSQDAQKNAREEGENPLQGDTQTEGTQTTGLQNHSDTGRQIPTSTTSRDSAAWDTLRSYRDDARLPEELLERIASALSPLAPASESEALALSGEVLDWLAKGEE